VVLVLVVVLLLLLKLVYQITAVVPVTYVAVIFALGVCWDFFHDNTEPARPGSIHGSVLEWLVDVLLVGGLAVAAQHLRSLTVMLEAKTSGNVLSKLGAGRSDVTEADSKRMWRWSVFLSIMSLLVLAIGLFILFNWVQRGLMFSVWHGNPAPMLW